MLSSSVAGFVCAALKSDANKPCIEECDVKQKGQSALCPAMSCFAPEFLEYLWFCVSTDCYAFQSCMLTANIFV